MIINLTQIKKGQKNKILLHLVRACFYGYSLAFDFRVSD